MINTDFQPIFRAIADPTRRGIIDLLARQDMPAGDVARHFDMTRPAVAKHLKILREGGIVTVRQEGRERINALVPEQLKVVSDWVGHYERFWSERLGKLQQIFEEGKDQ